MKAKPALKSKANSWILKLTVLTDAHLAQQRMTQADNMRKQAEQDESKGSKKSKNMKDKK